MPTSDPTALTCQNVSKTFRAGKRSVAAIKDVNFAIQTGKVTGLIGPDGAGKTTLMRLAAGLLRPDAGTLTVLGLDVVQELAAGPSQRGLHAATFWVV